MTVTRVGDSTYLSLTGGIDRLRIITSDEGAGIERVVFGDGTTWNLTSVVSDANPLVLTDTNTGSPLAYRFTGSAEGTNLNDVLVGGAGNDEMSGGEGND